MGLCLTEHGQKIVGNMLNEWMPTAGKIDWWKWVESEKKREKRKKVTFERREKEEFIW